MCLVLLDASEKGLNTWRILEEKSVRMGEKAKTVLGKFAECNHTHQQEDKWQMEMYVEDNLPP